MHGGTAATARQVEHVCEGLRTVVRG
jgi:hypothetical protein